MPAHAIRALGLSKRYQLTRRPFRRAGEFWALRDVGFEVGEGAALGIIGRNGSGKSTLLKVLSRITPPTAGRAEIRGRVGSLLEVGTGFNPELSGRDNVFLNGAILGMRQRDIARQLDAIVDFAGVAQFLDTPVKRYSSGMYVRLAFAVAAHLDPEILLVDEVLAVGDAAFQQRCLGKMAEAAHGGRTILFVSHNLGAVRTLCDRVVWLEGGKVAGDGEPRQVIEQYLAATADGELGGAALGVEGPLVIERVTVKDALGRAASVLPPGQNFAVEIAYTAEQAVDRPHFWISIASQHGTVFAANMLLDGRTPASLRGRGALSCTFRGVRLLPQTYTVTVGVRDAGGAAALVPAIKGAAGFRVTGEARDFGMPPGTAEPVIALGAPLLVDYTWRYADGTVASPPWVDRK